MIFARGVSRPADVDASGETRFAGNAVAQKGVRSIAEIGPVYLVEPPCALPEFEPAGAPSLSVLDL